MKTRTLVPPCVATLAAFALSLTSAAQETPFVLADFEEFGGAAEGTVFLRYPGFSDNYGHAPHGRGELDFSQVRSVLDLPEEAAGNPAIGEQVLHLRWEYLPEGHPDAPLNYRYSRVRTVPYSPSHITDPVISFEHPLRFDIFTNEPLEVALLLRETDSDGEYGSNGGRSGSVKWVGGRDESGNTIRKAVPIPPNRWVTVEFTIPLLAESALARTGSGPLTSTTGKGVLEALGFVGLPGVTYNVYLDNFVIAPANHALQVRSAVPGTTPEPGLYHYDPGTEITLTAPAEVEAADAIHSVIGWHGTGAAESGTGESLTLTLDEPTVVDWVWESEYQLPDSWKLEHFGTLDADPHADPDGDSFNNLTEYLRGSDPNTAEPLLGSDGIARPLLENVQRDPTLSAEWEVKDYGSGFRGAWEASNAHRFANNPYHPDGGPVDVVDFVSFDGPRLIVREDVWQEEWKDGTYETTFSVGDTKGVAIYFRYQDELNWYRVFVTGDAPTGAHRPVLGLSVQKRVNGQYYSILEQDTGLALDPEDQMYFKRARITVTADGDQFAIEASGWDTFLPQPEWAGPGDFGYVSFSFNDPDFEYGRAGIGTWAMGKSNSPTDLIPVADGALFEYFEIRRDSATVLFEDWSAVPANGELPAGWVNAYAQGHALAGQWRQSAHGSIVQRNATAGSDLQAGGEGPILLIPAPEAENAILEIGMHSFIHRQHPSEPRAFGFIFDYIDSENYGRVFFSNVLSGTKVEFDATIVQDQHPLGVSVARKVNGVWTDVEINGDGYFVHKDAHPFAVFFSRVGDRYALSIQERDRGETMYRYQWDDASGPAAGGRHGLATWGGANTHFLYANLYGVEVAPGVEGLQIVSITKDGDNIVLAINNPGEGPYIVQRTTDLIGDWETVDTERTESVWTGPIPAGEARVFWRLTR